MAEHVLIFIKIKPYADDWEENGTQPSKEIYLLLGKEGMLAAQLPPGPHLKNFKLPGNLESSKFDYFHELICH